ncbi:MULTISPECIES: CcdB family protein [unclassified Arsukibacterium]|uniref:CcdB family protein n=1 Tax=unclassified Arsukibacterium TaxID=2635278 RepID=UPI000C8956F7|nr:MULTISPECIES: CcdB family protein [unclassified Arsukibacterium]MAA93217.1 plasmid maintenance protein CcdB [Rheinheimera sp.]HAW92692.1 plasmid maintenance protein CcdB [Candidatus Azambacteria bacterium]|tara:strand:- start:12425 stop:12721 length:297 start_codon:yes stop_codon:yes gene_type:complete
MARFDVYKTNPAGYLLDVQTDLLSGLNTRVVVPLLPRIDAPKPASRLNPMFEIDGQQLVMVTQFMAAIPAAELKQAAASLAEHQHEVSEALDMLFIGF